MAPQYPSTRYPCQPFGPGVGFPLPLTADTRIHSASDNLFWTHTDIVRSVCPGFIWPRSFVFPPFSVFVFEHHRYKSFHVTPSYRSGATKQYNIKPPFCQAGVQDGHIGDTFVKVSGVR